MNSLSVHHSHLLPFLQVLIEATISRERRGYIAIDDIMVLNYPCCKCHFWQWTAITGDAGGKKIKKGLADWAEKMYFKAARHAKRMKSNGLSTFYIRNTLVLRLPATTAVLLKLFDAQMPTHTATWKQMCPLVSGLVWQPNIFVNQWNLQIPFAFTGLTEN